MSRDECSIIGGGITGLSLAYHLGRAGVKVTVYEASERLGGNCDWVKLGDTIVDRYYHVLSEGDGSLWDIINEIGITDRLFPIRTTMAYHQGGKTFPVRNLWEMLTFPPLKLYERFMLGVSFVRSLSVKDWKPLDLLLAREWLAKIGSMGLYNKLWKPIMAHKFGRYSNQVVATDMWFRMNRLYDTSKNRKNKQAYYIDGTLKVLFDCLESYLTGLGVDIYKMCPIEKIEVKNGCITSLALSDGNAVDTGRVLATIPLPAFSALLPDELNNYRDKLSRIVYLDNVCLILKSKSPITRHYQLGISDSDMPFTGIIGAHQMYPPEKYGGYITYVTRYFHGDNKLFETNAEELMSIYEPFLRRINKDFSTRDLVDMRLIKGRNVEAIHTVGYSKLLPKIQTPIKGLLLLCAAQIYPEPTVMDVASMYAKRLVKEILSESVT